jgi:hypothetical protein
MGKLKNISEGEIKKNGSETVCKCNGQRDRGQYPKKGF